MFDKRKARGALQRADRLRRELAAAEQEVRQHRLAYMTASGMRGVDEAMLRSAVL